MAQQQSQPLSQCIALTTEGAQIELSAMRLDREHSIQEAMISYRQAIEVLQRATDACPEDHPDKAVLGQHCQELLDRLAYLEGLPANAAPDLPLEVHINSVELTMQPCTDDQAAGGSSGGMRVLGAVAAIGGVAGMMLTRSAFGGLALAAGAAYTATRSDKAGEAARSLGQVGINGADKAKAVNEQYQITNRAKAAGVATVAKAQDLGGTAIATAKEIDAQYGIRERATAAGAKTVATAQDLDAQYHIRENAKKTADTVGKGLSAGLAVVSGVLQARRRGRSSNDPSVIAPASSTSEPQMSRPEEGLTQSS